MKVISSIRWTIADNQQTNYASGGDRGGGGTVKPPIYKRLNYSFLISEPGQISDAYSEAIRYTLESGITTPSLINFWKNFSKIGLSSKKFDWSISIMK